MTTDIIDSVIEGLDRWSAVTVATPASDTILQVDDDEITGIPDRSTLWHAQTPQGFDVDVLRSAYAAAGSGEIDFTDDTSVVRAFRSDVAVGVVVGPPDNIKITRPGDIEVAESLLEARGARKRPYSE